MNWLNQHSFLILVAAISILAVVMTSGIGRFWLRGIVLGVVAVAVVGRLHGAYDWHQHA